MWTDHMAVLILCSLVAADRFFLYLEEPKFVFIV